MPEQTFTVKVEEYVGDEKPFIPGEAEEFVVPEEEKPAPVEPLTFALQPIPEEPAPPTYPTGTPTTIIPAMPSAPEVPEKRRLIINIETEGYKPWKHKLIAIGLQDPLKPDEGPFVLINASERVMINSLFKIIKEGGYNELIGYGLSFDYRFILIKSMRYGITCKEFYDMDLYDTMQAAAQGKFAFVYYAQSPPKLSDLADYFWDYPKPFTDKQMIEYWKKGRLDKVREFTSSQITRILALYLLFNAIIKESIEITVLGAGSSASSKSSISKPPKESKLTIPEAHAPEMIKYRCPECLAEYEFEEGTTPGKCKICGAELIKKGGA